MKQASYSIALISELRIAVYTLQLHNKNCRLRSTTPIAVYDLQLHCNKLPSTIYYSRGIDYYLQSLSIQQKIPHPAHIYLAENTTFKILSFQQKITAENTAENTGGN
jgi:hypothetical protein